MNEEVKNIGIYSENLKFESDYIPFISFKTEKQKDASEKYIFTKANTFFSKIIEIEIDVRRTCIHYPKTIIDKDFKSVDINYFYNNIFFDLGKRDADNRLDFTPKWGITFDETCAPIEISYLTDNLPNDRNIEIPYFQPLVYRELIYQRYGTIDINKKPIFYYIYFSLQELLNEIKKIP